MISEELVFCQNKLIVPAELKNEILTKLHEAHLGIQKTKQSARNYVYWPGMTIDINLFFSGFKFVKNT